MSVVANVAINVDASKALQQIKSVDTAVDGLAKSAATVPSKINGGLDGLGNKLQALGGKFATFGGAIASLGAGAALKGFLDAGIAADRTSKTIQALAGSYKEVAGVNKIANDAAKVFGLGQTTAAKSVADLYGRLRPMGISLEDVGKTFNGVNKAAGLMNLTAVDTEGVMLQLSQAMGSGALQGDELRSIMERLPAVGQAVAKVMGVSVGEVKKLGSDGKITTDIIIKAMEELNKLKPPAPDPYKLYTAALEDLQTTIGTKLLPVFTPFLQALTNLIQKFSKLPQPLQNIIVGIGGLIAVVALVAAPLGFLISGIGSLMTALAAAKVGATIAGWAALAGPAVTAMTAAFAGFMTFLTGTLLPGLLAIFSGPVGWTVLAVAAVVAMAIAFREPIMQFFAWIGGAISTAFSGLIELLQPIFVQPFIDLWNNVLRGPVTAMFNWIGGYIQSSMRNAYDLAYAVFVQPWLILWNTLRSPVVELFSWIGSYIKTSMAVAYALAYAVFVLPFIALWENVLRGPVTAFVGWLQNAWNSIFSYFNNNVVAPIRNAWNTLSTLLAQTANTISTNVSKAWGSIVKFFVDNVTKPISTAWTNLITFLPKAANTMGETVKSVFANVGSSIKGVLNGVLRGVFGAVNGAIANINSLIQRANAISKKVNGPQIPELPILNIPQFAKGGYVGKGTLAVVGEAGPEYIIPASKMAAASANYLNGARGGAVIPAFANGGFVGGGNAQISVTTGPVLQQGGQQYVTMADLEKAMRKTADGVYASLRTPSSRIALGAR